MAKEKRSDDAPQRTSLEAVRYTAGYAEPANSQTSGRGYVPAFIESPVQYAAVPEAI